MLFDLTLQLRTNLSGPSTACANVMDCRELSVDHTEMLATAGSGRVAIDDVEVSDDVRTPEAVVTVSADSLDHLSAEHLQLPALERNVDEGTASAVALTTSSVPVSDEVAVERPGLPETLESKCREQAEELDHQPAAAAALNTDVSDQLAGEYEAKLESLGEFQLEQLENVQVAIKVFLFHVSQLADVFFSGFIWIARLHVQNIVIIASHLSYVLVPDSANA